MKQCKFCGVAEDLPHPYRHKFVGEDTPEALQETPGDQQGADPSLPIDPVLRIALIDKGILTADDLAEAQSKINVVDGNTVISSS